MFPLHAFEVQVEIFGNKARDSLQRRRPYRCSSRAQKMSALEAKPASVC